MVKRLLKQKLEKYFPGVDFDILVPPDDKMGDYSTNVAFVLAKKEGKDPMKVGEELAVDLRKDRDLIGIFEKIEVVKPGFVNFFLGKEFLQKQLEEIYKKRDSFGKSDAGKGKTVIVEYSSPNIAKPMHIGHLRSTVIGDALANVYESLGYKIIRWNYVGDWGTQFGKLIAAWKKWGKEFGGTNTLNAMLRLYVQYHEETKKHPELEGIGQEEFKKLEQGDPENRKLWELFREESIREFKRIYDDLNINFDFERDVAKSESGYEKDLPAIIELLKPDLKKSEGALVFEFSPEAIPANLPSTIVVKSDGASVYLTRELATLKDRLENYKPDKILYVVANQQTLHFEQLFAIAKKLGKKIGLRNTELIHVKFGMVLGEDGKKLATREGKVIPLQDVIDKIVALAGKVVKEKNPELSEKESDEIAKAVGVGALKYGDLKQHPHTDMVFDWEAMLDISGNSGPYLQYTYARLSSILVKAGPTTDNRQPIICELLNHELELRLMKRLLEFPDAVEKCADLNALNGLALYLYEFSNDINRFYESVRVLDDENIERRNTRLMLAETAAAVLERGLNILGIKALKRV
ncbi:MAG: arginine--tRNA ligase [Candidatus Yanofskybacteria bacterium RIFCSPHIGHO2_01_FULL_43_42]|uniref:Arginine--tRNA ligase n=1 Tax=Candidatus Yanofskybacteria bacterium RIFCSPLOWO2_01_FULL_43_22 TaxID=1802695 RepID=A0A1F8GHV7_9BACT|nr:MAG: arginine--tRNA ligase [Candidatus Yanofskybacteria bacterium RIFCSPHIGHO2_01_FULL_43_42]OGN12912.1 MAG: arginine--tRNA ligase [Candidatus Yanofskybacteria bacterium RIFCSPHIGHO2_02_FULL_43_17]OGN24009.1 MAG: arginine--tRNA ligase [Candidatus Yanofskybacteria bacterium RIFCSPLOWO2_01_FULL_43_22]